MRNYVLIALLAFAAASPAFAELYVVVDAETKEVITASEHNDTNLAPGQKLVVMREKFEDLLLNYPITDYKVVRGNRLVVDTQKTTKRENRQKKARLRAVEEKLIERTMRKMAIEKLAAEGVDLKHVTE